jgi:tetratricopeptide (TPR) repeat protein
MMTAPLKRVGTLLLLLLLVAGYPARAQQPLIDKANKAYSQGLFAEAAGLYTKVAESGYTSPELCYNLGNAWFKQNDMAKAILWYERALRLDPGNEDIRFNLKVANSKISDKIEPLPELFYKRWYNGVVLWLAADAWAWLSIVMLAFALALGALYLVSRILILRKIGFWMGLTVLALALFSLLFAWSGHRMANNATEAVIFSPTLTVKSSPDEKSTDLFVLHEGTRVRIQDQIGTWYEIRIASGSVGWVPASAVEKI